MADDGFRKMVFTPGSFVLFPQKQDVEKRLSCSNPGDLCPGIPLYANYWCESLRHDHNWCRHTNYPYASLELILEGKVEYISDGCKCEASAGDLFIFTQGGDSWYIQRSSTRKIFLIIDGTMFSLLMKELGFTRDTLIHLEDPAAAERQFRAIYDSMMKMDETGVCQGSTLLWQLLLDLSMQHRRALAEEKEPANIKKKVTLLRNKNMLPAPNEEIARLLGVSKRSLYGVFKEHYGESPHQWQRRQRLERAAELLRTTEKTVTECAALCGFRNVKYFLTLFKKSYGLSPGAWRREQKQPER